MIAKTKQSAAWMAARLTFTIRDDRKNKPNKKPADRSAGFS
jgi:hypothetical protein